MCTLVFSDDFGETHEVMDAGIKGLSQLHSQFHHPFNCLSDKFYNNKMLILLMTSFLFLKKKLNIFLVKNKMYTLLF